MKSPLWEVLGNGKFVELVRQDHKAKNALVGTGHDFGHALMVAQYILQITDDWWCGQLAWIAAICHNTDRLFPIDSDEQIEKRVLQYLHGAEILEDSQHDIVVQAVLNHSNRPSVNDGPVTILLMDADKLANIGASLALRSAQFQPNLPIIDLRYLDQRPPGTSFKKPGSIYWDIKSSLEWAEEGWIRTPKAKELAKPLFAELQMVLDGLVRQFKDVGLLPYPFPEDFGN